MATINVAKAKKIGVNYKLIVVSHPALGLMLSRNESTVASMLVDEPGHGLDNESGRFKVPLPRLAILP